MNRKEAKLRVQNHVVRNPCPMRWEDMQGDNRKRFCEQCRLTVHNISDMSDVEAAAIIGADGERTCVYMYKKADGTVVTDNCPRALRPIRNKIGAGALVALIAVTAASSLAAGPMTASLVAAGPMAAPPIVGATAHEVGQLADYGYDMARNILRCVETFTCVICFVWPLSAEKKDKLKVLILEFLALASAPVLTHLVGTFCINNYGGLGGGF
jgi:hypothetical protein